LAKFKVYKIALQRTNDLWQKERAFFFNNVLFLQVKTKVSEKLLVTKHYSSTVQPLSKAKDCQHYDRTTFDDKGP